LLRGWKLLYSSIPEVMLRMPYFHQCPDGPLCLAFGLKMIAAVERLLDAVIPA